MKNYNNPLAFKDLYGRNIQNIPFLIQPHKGCEFDFFQHLTEAFNPYLVQSSEWSLVHLEWCVTALRHSMLVKLGIESVFCKQPNKKEFLCCTYHRSTNICRTHYYITDKDNWMHFAKTVSHLRTTIKSLSRYWLANISPNKSFEKFVFLDSYVHFTVALKLSPATAHNFPNA